MNPATVLLLFFAALLGLIPCWPAAVAATVFAAVNEFLINH